MSERRRYFSRQERIDHAEEIGGWHSELIDPTTGLPYEGTIESHHMDAFGNGGETEPDNLMFLDRVSHAVIHLMSDEPYSFRLIFNRLTPEEKQELHRRTGWTL